MRKRVTVLAGVLTVMMGAAGRIQAGDRMLIAMNGSAETLSVLNLETNAVMPNVGVTGQVPNQIVAHEGRIYILNSGTDDIQVVDPQQQYKIIRTIALDPGNNPWAMAFDAGGRLWVTNYLDNSVSVVDVGDGTVLETIPVGISPEGILVRGGRAYVANTGYVSWDQPYAQATVSVIDLTARRVIHTLNVPVNAQDLAMDPRGRIQVICSGNYYDTWGRIAVIDLHGGPDGNTPFVSDTLAVGGSPGDLVITAAGKGYCVDWGDGVHGRLCSWDALADTVIHDSDSPLLIGPNVSRLFYDDREDVLWIPTMTEWDGDGFVQKFDVARDEVVWISGVLGNGTQDVTILEPVTSGVERVPGEDGAAVMGLYPCRPNPFNPETRIRYDVPKRQAVHLAVFNIMGQRVCILAEGVKEPGAYTVRWDGTDGQGRPVPGGLYLYCLTGKGFHKTGKMMLVR